MVGTQAWIDAYHGTDKTGKCYIMLQDDSNAMYLTGERKESFSSLVMPRSGAIQGVVNLDFPGTQDYESLGIFFGNDFYSREYS